MGRNLQVTTYYKYKDKNELGEEAILDRIELRGFKYFGQLLRELKEEDDLNKFINENHRVKKEETDQRDMVRKYNERIEQNKPDSSRR